MPDKTLQDERSLDREKAAHKKPRALAQGLIDRAAVYQGAYEEEQEEEWDEEDEEDEEDEWDEEDEEDEELDEQDEKERADLPRARQAAATQLRKVDTVTARKSPAQKK